MNGSFAVCDRISRREVAERRGFMVGVAFPALSCPASAGCPARRFPRFVLLLVLSAASALAGAGCASRFERSVAELYEGLYSEGWGYSIDTLIELAEREEESVPFLIEVMLDESGVDQPGRHPAAYALGMIGGSAAPALGQALQNGSTIVRRRAADGLMLCGMDAREVIPTLIACARSDPDEEVRRSCRGALACTILEGDELPRNAVRKATGWKRSSADTVREERDLIEALLTTIELLREGQGDSTCEDAIGMWRDFLARHAKDDELAASEPESQGRRSVE